MRYLQLFLKRHKGKTVLAVLLLLGQVVGTLLIPALVANIVDHGILVGDMGVVLQTGLLMLAVTFLAAGISAWGSWATSDLASLFGREMRSMLLRKSQELSIQQFDAVGISSMITRTSSDMTNLQRTMGMVLQMVVPAPIIVVVSIFMTTMVSPGGDPIGFYGGLIGISRCDSQKVQHALPQHSDKAGPDQSGGAGSRYRSARHPGLRQGSV